MSSTSTLLPFEQLKEFLAKLSDPNVVLALAPNLSALQKRATAKIIGNNQQPAGSALVYWLADLLASTKLCNDDELRLILEECAPVLISYGEQLKDFLLTNRSGEENPIPVSLFSISDRRWIALSKLDHFIDLQTGDTSAKVAKQFLEVVSYNLATLFISKLYELLGKAGSHGSHQPSGAEQ